MESRVWRQIWLRVGAKAPEAGGVLLGPMGRDLVSEFFFDDGGRCTGGSYTPDHEAINARFRADWRPRGLTLKGMVHSHPQGFTGLSRGDLVYIRRILQCNPDMQRFLAPIVIPDRFWMRPFVIHRDPWAVEEAVLDLVDSD